MVDLIPNDFHAFRKEDDNLRSLVREINQSGHEFGLGELSPYGGWFLIDLKTDHQNLKELSSLGIITLLN